MGNGPHCVFLDSSMQQSGSFLSLLQHFCGVTMTINPPKPWQPLTPPKCLFCQREKISSWHYHQGTPCSPQARVAFPTTGTFFIRVTKGGLLQKGQPVFGPFHPTKAVFYYYRYRQNFRPLGLLQGEELTGGRKCMGRAGTTPPSPCPLLSPAPWGGQVTGAQSEPFPQFVPKLQGSPKPSIHKELVLEARLRVPPLQTARQ